MGGYLPINDIYEVNDFIKGEYLSIEIIENNPDFFGRVYKINLIKSVVFKGREEAKKLLNKEYK